MREALAITATAALTATQAPAAVQCGPAGVISFNLGARYQETAVDQDEGETKSGSAIIWEVWASEKTGTWTFTMTVDGRMCAIVSGVNYDGATVANMLIRHGLGLDGRMVPAA